MSLSASYIAQICRLRVPMALPLLAAFLVVAPTSAHAAGAPVHGQVSDGSNPVAGAFVALTGPTGTLHLAFARSGAGAGIHYATKAPAGAWRAPVRVSAVSGDSVPSMTADSAGKAHLVYRRTASGPGLYYVTNRTGRWASAAKVSGSAAGDTAGVVAAGSSSLRLAFVRGGAIWTSTKTWTRPWAVPVRRTTGKADSAPALAVDGSGVNHLVFRRATGPAGLYAMTDRGGRWGAPARVPGTGAADAAPTVVIAGAREYLAFPRTGGSTAGVYLASRTVTGRWGQPARRSDSARDITPTVTVDNAGHVLAVFDRG